MKNGHSRGMWKRCVSNAAKKVLRSRRREVEEEGKKLSITEGETEGQSRRGGVGFPHSVETFGVDLRITTKQWGAKEKTKRRKCDVRFSIAMRNHVFQKKYMRIDLRKLLRMGLVLAGVWGGQAVGISPTERLILRRQMTAAAGKKAFVEEDLTTMTTLFWAEGVEERHTAKNHLRET